MTSRTDNQSLKRAMITNGACLLIALVWTTVLPIAFHFVSGRRIVAIDGIPATVGMELRYWAWQYGGPTLGWMALPMLVSLTTARPLSVVHFGAILGTLGTFVAVLTGSYFNRYNSYMWVGVAWHEFFSPAVAIPLTYLAYLVVRQPEASSDRRLG